MSANKHQIIRLTRLDRCFQNTAKEYTFDSLLKEVNDALLEHDPSGSGVQIRTLRKDIAFMRSTAGYDAPIDTFKGTNGICYRYSDSDFSIYKSELSETEAQQLKNAISILQRFEGSPEFEWVNEIAPLLNDRFGLKNQEQKVMSLESNIDYKGSGYITPLFNAIVNKTVLKIRYAPFDQNEYTVTFHPYFLKQYNNRWFVFGYNEYNGNAQWNLALDRINGEIQKTNLVYRSDDTDWFEFFDDIIGVSKDPEKQLQEIKLLFSPEQAPYISTKPLHPSQKARLIEDGSLEVRIYVIPNYELETRILSFGEKVKVVAPTTLVSAIKKRIVKLSGLY